MEFSCSYRKQVEKFFLPGVISRAQIYSALVAIGVGQELGLDFSAIKEILKKVKPIGNVKLIYSGCSGGCILPKGNLDPDNFRKKGAIIGNCGIMVVNDENCVIEIAKNIAGFFVHESCGKCTPCREGTFRVLELLEKISETDATKKDLELLEELVDFISSTSFCALGRFSTVHIKTVLRYFKKDFLKKCK